MTKSGWGVTKVIAANGDSFSQYWLKKKKENSLGNLKVVEAMGRYKDAVCPRTAQHLYHPWASVSTTLSTELGVMESGEETP